MSILAGVMLCVRLGKELVRIELLDPSLTVRVDEEDAIVFEGLGAPIRLRPGEHELIVDRDGMHLGTKVFTVTRGDDLVLRVSRNENDEAIVLWPGDRLPSSAAKASWTGWPEGIPPPAIAPFDASQAKRHQRAWAGHLGLPVEYENSIGMRFVLIPAGEFAMGSKAAEVEAALVAARDDEIQKIFVRSESPAHKVILTRPIYLGVHEVTQAQYQQVMGQTPSHFSPTGLGKKALAGIDTANHPAETLSWSDAAEFCAKLSEKEQFRPFYSRSDEAVTMLEGNGYRLPTEAEWEFACRAGTTTKYWSGENDASLAEGAWFAANSGNQTRPVGALAANPFGLCDTQGNVWEWVQDVWEPSYYMQFQKSAAVDPTGPAAAGLPRVLRGGDWGSWLTSCLRPSRRHAYTSSSRRYMLGFRVALVVGSGEERN